MSHAKYVLLSLAEKLTGYTVKAMEQKIDSGVWLEGVVWMRAPDGKRHIIMEGYHKWVETGQGSSPAKRRSKSASQTEPLAA
jgi:hypothetical protein